MKSLIITEFVKFRSLETTTPEQLVSCGSKFHDLQKRPGGYIDSELVKTTDANCWHLILHYQNMDTVKSIGGQIRSGKEFAGLTKLPVPESIEISFHQQFKYRR